MRAGANTQRRSGAGRFVRLAAIAALLVIGSFAGAESASAAAKEDAATAAPSGSCAGPCPIVIFSKGSQGGVIEIVTRYSDKPDVTDPCSIGPWPDKCTVQVDEFADEGVLLRPASLAGFRGWQGCPGSTTTCTLPATSGGSVCVAFGTPAPESACPPPFVQAYKKGDGKGIITANGASGVTAACQEACSVGIWDHFPPGDRITLRALPTAGTFLRWELCPGATANECVVTLANVVTVCAVFVRAALPTDTSCPASTPPNPAPTTRITAGPSPARATRSRRATFRFVANEAGSTFRCKLDARPWHSCRSPKTYRSLRVGYHTFRVQAVDPTGKRDVTPAVRRWRIRR